MLTNPQPSLIQLRGTNSESKLVVGIPIPQKSSNNNYLDHVSSPSSSLSPASPTPSLSLNNLSASYSGPITVSQDPFSPNCNDYERLERVGKGSFGEVHKV